MNVLDGTIEFLQDVLPNDASENMNNQEIEASVLHILRERFWNNKSLTWINSGKSTGILFCEEIDVGEAEPRNIASGLRAHYKAEDLQGRRVLILANLKSRKLVGFPSHGMVLCASSDDGKVVFVDPPAGASIGERVMVDGYNGEPATENQVIKKKMLDAIFPDLKTDSDGVACYKGVPLTAGGGKCLAEGGLPDSQVS